MKMLGQSQSPVGSFATTSTLPYLMLTELRVVNLADRTGLITVKRDEFDTATHWDTLVDVQVPSAVRFRVYPLVIASSPIMSDVRVGTR
jgi:hypothetical protein